MSIEGSDGDDVYMNDTRVLGQGLCWEGKDVKSM